LRLNGGVTLKGHALKANGNEQELTVIPYYA